MDRCLWPLPPGEPSGSRVSLIPTHKGGGRADGAEALRAEEGPVWVGGSLERWDKKDGGASV